MRLICRVFFIKKVYSDQLISNSQSQFQRFYQWLIEEYCLFAWDNSFIYRSRVSHHPFFSSPQLSQTLQRFSVDMHPYRCYYTGSRVHGSEGEGEIKMIFWPLISRTEITLGLRKKSDRWGDVSYFFCFIPSSYPFQSVWGVINDWLNGGDHQFTMYSGLFRSPSPFIPPLSLLGIFLRLIFSIFQVGLLPAMYTAAVLFALLSPSDNSPLKSQNDALRLLSSGSYKLITDKGMWYGLDFSSSWLIHPFLGFIKKWLHHRNLSSFLFVRQLPIIPSYVSLFFSFSSNLISTGGSFRCESDQIGWSG